MVYFNRPTVTRTYTQVLTDLDAKIDAATALLSSDVTAYDNQGGSFPVRAIRWNASSSKFERRNSANNAWESLTSNHVFDSITAAGNISANTGNISGVDLTASDELSAARVNVTGATKPANGLYRAATNEVRFTTNSSDRLTIESNGEVGIGVVDPAQQLHVNGNARITNGTNTAVLELGKSGGGNHHSSFEMYSDNTSDYAFRIVRTSGTNGITEINHSGTGDFIIEADDAADMLFQTSNTTRLVVDSGGNIGIGTSESPSDLLHIKRTDAAGTFIRLENTEGSAYLGADNDDLLLRGDVVQLQNQAGGSTYLEASSSLFDVKTAAKVNGNLEVTGTVSGSISGTAAVASTVTVADESTDTSCNVLFATAATGNLGAKSGTNLTFNSNTGALTATSFVGALTGTATNATNLKSGTTSYPVSSSGNRFGVVPVVDSSGVVEIGKYLDFHNTDGGGTGDNCRLWTDGVSLSISNNLIPTGSRNLGSATARWNNLYINDLQLSNEGQSNDVDGTWGNYTIQEGENDLYLLNRRNGKTYKFNLTEVGQIS